MYSVFAPVFWSHLRRSLAPNSGPLSDRMCSGIPRWTIASDSYSSYTRTRRQCLFHNPPLLLNCAPTPTAPRTFTNQIRIHRDALLHTGIVYPTINHVQTAETKRLQSGHSRR
jgi:hypothetical protein